ncbi:MAG: NYN domain-containing protein [Victivallales bacterium]
MTFNDTKQSVPFRCAIYFDWLNIKMNGGKDLSFDRLFDHIRGRGGIIRIANFYAPEPEGNQISFYDAVKRSGFKIVYIQEKGRCGRGQFNCDTLMAVDMVTQTEGLDAVYLLTNDFDFIHPVRYLRAKGIRTMLIHVESPSNDLREEVDEWKHAGQLNLLENRKDTSKEI